MHSNAKRKCLLYFGNRQILKLTLKCVKLLTAMFLPYRGTWLCGAIPAIYSHCFIRGGFITLIKGRWWAGIP